MVNINYVAVFLITLTLLGVLSNNSTLTISAVLLLLIQQTALSAYLPFIEKHGVYIGIIVLTIGVLSPLVSGKIALPHITELASLKMIGAICIGIFVAWLAGRGVPLMTEQPTVVIGLMLGTIIGVAFLGGIPVGPLIAAGLLSLFVGKV